MNKLILLFAIILSVSVFSCRNTEVSCSEADLSPNWANDVTAEQRRIIGELINSMILVKGGTFIMGSKYGDGDEKPTHRVTLSDYFIGKFEVTQEQWQIVMGNNPSYFKGSRKPVEQVSWNDCQKFIKKLNQLTGLNFALPTEAQWEFAARGGNKSKGYKYSGGSDLNLVGWWGQNYHIHDGNSGRQTHPVGQKSPNELGLYDMSGNVWEWCQDWYGDYSRSSQTNPTGLSTGSSRVDRGGSWFSSARSCRVYFRDSYYPNDSYDFNGLRLAVNPK